MDSPISVPIEQITLKTPNAEIIQYGAEKVKLEWEVIGCAYSWRVFNSLKDVRFLHEAVFSLPTKPVGLTRMVPFEGSDLAMLGELEGVLMNYSSVLISLPVDRLFKQNYCSFKKRFK